MCLRVQSVDLVKFGRGHSQQDYILPCIIFPVYAILLVQITFRTNRFFFSWVLPAFSCLLHTPLRFLALALSLTAILAGRFSGIYTTTNIQQVHTQMTIELFRSLNAKPNKQIPKTTINEHNRHTGRQVGRIADKQDPPPTTHTQAHTSTHKHKQAHTNTNKHTRAHNGER